MINKTFFTFMAFRI